MVLRTVSGAEAPPDAATLERNILIWVAAEDRLRNRVAREAGGHISSPQRKLWVNNEKRAELAKRAA